MGNVEEAKPPASVAFEGHALSVVARLSVTAKLLAESVETDADFITESAVRRLREAAAMLDRVIDMMDAIDITLDRFESGADRILEVMQEGEESSFCNKASDKYYVSGVLARRLQTLTINVLGLNADLPKSYANLNVGTSIILLRGTRHKTKVAFRVAC